MKKLSYLFIVNPVAGKNKGAKVLLLIERVMKRKKIPHKIIQTTEIGEAQRIAKEAVNKEFSTIVAVGGDGTIHEVLNGIVGSNKILGIIPAGTGNDLSRTLNLPHNPELALELILQGKTKAIDLGKANGKYFINFASIGLDAVIASEANYIKKYISGKIAYILAAIKGINLFKSREIKFIIDDKKISEKVMMITVCNGIYYGGGMMIAPKAMLEDGYFDVCVIKKMNKLKLLALFPTIYLGKHVNYKEVEFYRAKKVKIISEDHLQVNADGELIHDKALEFEVLQQRLEIIINPSS